MRGYDARLPKADGTQLGHYSTSVDGLCWWRFSKKKHYTSLQKPCVEYNIAIPSYDR